MHINIDLVNSFINGERDLLLVKDFTLFLAPKEDKNSVYLGLKIMHVPSRLQYEQVFQLKYRDLKDLKQELEAYIVLIEEPVHNTF